MVARLASHGGRTRASAATAARSTAYPPKAQNSSRGVITTTMVKSTVAAIFTSGASRCTGAGAVEVERVSVARAHIGRLRPRYTGAAASRGWPSAARPARDRAAAAPADQPESAGAETERDQHPGTPARPFDRYGLSMPLIP